MAKIKITEKPLVQNPPEDYNLFVGYDIDDVESLRRIPVSALKGDLSGSLKSFLIPDVNDSVWEQGNIADSGALTDSNRHIRTKKLLASPNTMFTFTGIVKGDGEESSRVVYAFCYDKDGVFISPKISFSSHTRVFPNNTHFVVFSYGFVSSSGITINSYGFNNLIHDWGMTFDLEILSTDSSLSIAKKPADSKAVGDRLSLIGSNIALIDEKVNENYAEITDLTNVRNADKITTWINNAYIINNGTTVDINSPTERQGSRYAIIPCNQGDVFTVNKIGSAGPGGRAWSFIDNSGNIILLPLSGILPENQVIIAPANADNLIVNSAIGEGNVYKGVVINESVNILSAAVNVTAHLEYIPMIQYGYIKLNLNVGTTIDTIPKAATGNYYGYRYAIADCIPGDEFIISCVGANEARPYAFLDNSYNLITVASGGTVTNKKVKAPINSAYIILNDVGNKYSFKVVQESNAEVINEYNFMHSNLEEQEYFPKNVCVDDLLRFEKVRCIHHDNFARDNNSSDIGDNGSDRDNPLSMPYGTLSNVSAGIMSVGINNNRAVATRTVDVPNANIMLKTVDAGGFPYKILVSCEDDGGVTNYYGSIGIGIETVAKYVLINFNRNLVSIEPNSTTQINESVSVTHNSGVSTYEIYVYKDRIAIYNIGVKLIDISANMISTLCGMRFRAGNCLENGITSPYAYTNFCIFVPAKWINIGFDRAWEQYSSVAVVQGAGQTEEDAVVARNNKVVKSIGTFQTLMVHGINADTENTVLSDKSIRFELQYGDRINSNGVRSEIVPHRPYKDLTLHSKILDFDVFFNTDYDYDYNSDLIMQMHDVPDGINIGGLSPGIALVVYEDNLCITTQGSGLKILRNEDKPTTKRTVLTTLPKNQWSHITIYLREGYIADHNPVVAVWLNGELKTIDRGINAYNEPWGSYIKFGIYKSWKDGPTNVSSRVLLFDNVNFWY